MAALALPLAIALGAVLWRTPIPITDSIGLFEDASRRSISGLLTPGAAYFRPLFLGTLAGLWHGTDSIDHFIVGVRLLHLIPLTLLLGGFIAYVRPASATHAAAATVAIAVLLGSPALLGNLELPHSHTVVGMPAAFAAWALLERRAHPLRAALVVALTIIAVGFKEQGLVLVPLIVVAWWGRAPGATARLAGASAALAAAYVAFRMYHYDSGQVLQFEQDVGLGFQVLSNAEAAERFGAFPLWIYAYNAVSTVSNVLFAEPTEGVFRITHAAITGRLEPWHVVHLSSSLLLAAVIAWWAFGTLREVRRQGRWTPEARAALAFGAVLLASGALSFNYSRDRLGGMAVPFHALAAYYAISAAIARAAAARLAAATAVLVVVFGVGMGWQLRAIYTVSFSVERALSNHREWITKVARRERDFAERPAYVDILAQLKPQGTAPPRVYRFVASPLVRFLGAY